MLHSSKGHVMTKLELELLHRKTREVTHIDAYFNCNQIKNEVNRKSKPYSF